MEYGEMKETLKVDEKKHKQLRIGNSVAFIIAMALNGAAQGLGPVTLRELTEQMNTTFAPATWAFSIWGVVYFLLAIWTVYQALPSDKVSGRNDDVSVNQIGWIFSLNMILNGLWLVIFIQNTSTAFLLSLFVIIGMLVS